VVLVPGPAQAVRLPLASRYNRATARLYTTYWLTEPFCEGESAEMNERELLREAIERGMARASGQDWSGAIEAFRRAVSCDSNSVEARYRLGWALWRRSEEMKPTTGDLLLGGAAHALGFDSFARERGNKFKRHKKLLQDSVHWLREAIARDPHHAESHYLLAQALKGLGYKDEAVTVAKKAAVLQPESTKYATLVQAYSEEARLPGEYAPRTETGAGLTWDDLVLAPKTKRELRQMQIMLEKPAMAKELGVEAPTGILLKGAPGTGKTTIARVLASEAKCRFFSITPADINQMFVGVSEQRVRDLFARARANAPSIIFIDEIDALLPARQGGVAIHSDKVVNQFLQEMDGMTPNSRVFIVGASNRPDMLDPAVRRGGRLSREIEIPLPDRDARFQLLGLFTKGVKLAADVNLDDLADRTEGYSGADLKAVVNEAGLQALIRLADTAESASERVLTNEDFAEALANIDDVED
jgi:transitional endoplasmic reticulum ATPase